MMDTFTGKKLSGFDLFCLGVNAIVGSGIFLLPGILAKAAGPSSILAFFVCGILLVFVALCYAELGSMYRRNGGSYVYAREAFGSLAGFGVGWMAWVTAIFSWAAVANAVSAYMGYFHPVFETVFLQKCVACGMVVTFGIINYRGIKLGAWTVNFFTIAKLAPLVFFIVIGFFYISGAHYHPFWRSGNSSFGYAVFLALWSLQGFEITPLPAGEAQNPQRAVPYAAVGSLLFSTLLYVCIQAVAIGVYPELSRSATKPLADAAVVFLGVAGGTIMALGAVISMIGYNAGNALGSPRFLSALAEDRFLPERLSLPHTQFFTPSESIFLTTALTAVAAIFFNFESLVNISNFAVILQYFSTCAAVVWLRYKRPCMDRRFTLPFGNAIAILGCIISLWLIRQVKPLEFAISCGVLMVGYIVMWFFKKWQR